MLAPLQELDVALESFVEQAEHLVLLLSTRDEELALVTKAVDKLDQASPGDVVFFDLAPIVAFDSYVDGLVDRIAAELIEVNAARAQEGLPPLPPLPDGCRAQDVEPAKRLRWMLTRMGTWLPAEGDHRLVVALLPSAIIDHEAHANLVGSLVPHGGYEPWMSGLRIIVREDRAEPYVEEQLRARGLRGVALYTTHLTTPEIADALADEVKDRELPKPQRMNALLQLAAIDTSVGRFDEAIVKYGAVYNYCDEANLPELKASVVFGVGDIFGRVGRLEEARAKYMQALDVASDARSLSLIMQCTVALGEVNERTGRGGEAVRCFELAAAAAEKLMNPFVGADSHERAGLLRLAGNDPRGAATHFLSAAEVARAADYYPRLATVLERLRDLAGSAGYAEDASAYDDELRATRARLGAS